MNKKILIIFCALSATITHPSGKPPLTASQETADQITTTAPIPIRPSASIAIRSSSRARTAPNGDADELSATGHVSPSFVEGTMALLARTRETPPKHPDILHRSLSDAEIAAFQAALTTSTGKKGPIK